jgi:opacity protein-like surface antigen
MKKYNLLIASGLVVFNSICPSSVSASSDGMIPKQQIGDTYYGINIGLGIAGLNDLKDGFYRKNPQNSVVFSAVIGRQLSNNNRFDVSLKRFNSFNYEAPDQDELVFSEEAQGLFKTSHRSSLQSTILGLNAAHDFMIKNSGLFFTASAGIGLAYNTSKDATITPTYDPALQNVTFKAITHDSYKFPERSKYSFAWNAGLGLSYKLRDNAIIDIIQYNHQSVGNFETKEGYSILKPQEVMTGLSLKTKLVSHTVSTGIRIFF